MNFKQYIMNIEARNRIIDIFEKTGIVDHYGMLSHDAQAWFSKSFGLPVFQLFNSERLLVYNTDILFKESTNLIFHIKEDENHENWKTVPWDEVTPVHLYNWCLLFGLTADRIFNNGSDFKAVLESYEDIDFNSPEWNNLKL